MMKTRTDWREFWRSRPLQLAFSVLMLTLSVLFTADFFKIRGDDTDVLREARKSVAEALAVQLSALASVSDLDGIRYSVSSFVSRNPDVLAAGLVDDTGVHLAGFGDMGELTNVDGQSTLQYLSVPIFNGNVRWGEVQVVFEPRSSLGSEVRYYAFVLAACFLVYLLFLRRTLQQLDPSRAVPGRVHSAFDMLSEGVAILDEKLCVLLVNEALARSVGKPAASLVGQRLDDWTWEQSGEWQAPWQTVVHTGINITNQPLRLRLDGDEVRTYMVNCAAVGAQDGSARGVLVTLDDMTAIERKNRELALTLRQLRKSQEDISRKNRELEALATQDPLTGLANRRALVENLERQFARSRRESRELSCIMVDIDHFKQINDTLGHAAGDEVICAVASKLQEVCREYDFVGRYGGEEFVVVLPDLGLDNATTIAERLRAAVEKMGSDRMVPVDALSASFGVAALTGDVDDAMALVEQADQALYAAKQGGRNRVVAYSTKVVPLKPAANDEPKNEPDPHQRVAELEAIVDERTKDLELLRDFDDLTGIPKRTVFFERIEAELTRAERFKTKIGVLSLELKDLGRISASLGHEAAEALIVDVVERLHESLRGTDVVTEISQEHSLSRIEANEFGVLLTDLGDVSNVMPVVSRLRRVLGEPFSINGQSVYAGANIGLAVYPNSGSSARELLSNAGAARAKAARKPGKIAHSFASSVLDEESREYVQLEADLYEAVAQDAFELHYQPIYDVVERRIAALEALLRWRHPERGYVPPDRFVPIAESNGLIHRISEFVLRTGTAQLARWHAQGLDHLRLAVNISPVQIRNAALASDLLTTLRTAGLAPSALEVELTEGSIMDAPQRARVVLGQMREAGISVSMDDFGTGYSSLALLADLPLDSVKIDRAFISAMEDSERSRSIVESVINMAHALRLKVIAEGVETNEQLGVLNSMGCQELQGYLISKPLPADEVTQFLLQHRRGSDRAAL